jgi:hypothetical protein
MPAPLVTITTQPVVAGNLVFLPTAPLSSNGKPRGRILFELTMTNNTAAGVTATEVVTTFASATAPGSSTRTVNMTLKPFETLVWNPARGTDHTVFDVAAMPTSATLAVYFSGYSDPIKLTYPITAHTGPDTIGPYKFPSLNEDLELGEFWQLNGSSHVPGNHQGFAYDIGMSGTNHDTGDGYSELRNGKDPWATKAPNADYRVWGKPVRAMADGEIIEIVKRAPTILRCIPTTPTTCLP